jgi:hypothetical protein
LTSDRIYRPGLTSHEALKYLYNQRNTAFDQSLVLRFIHAMGTYPVGSLVKLTSGEVALVISAHPAHRLTPRVRIILDPNGHRYPSPVIVDLANQYTTPGIAPLGIVGVVSRAKHGIDLTEYVQLETGLSRRTSPSGIRWDSLTISGGK